MRTPRRGPTCGTCGTRTVRSARFCPRCGALLGSADVAGGRSRATAGGARRDRGRDVVAGARAGSRLRRSRPARLATAVAAVGILLTAGVAADRWSTLRPEPVGADEVELPSADALPSPGTGSADASDRRADGPRLLPACFEPGGDRCGELVPVTGRTVDATPVVFGALVVDATLRLHRLHLGDRGTHVRWTVDLDPSTAEGLGPHHPGSRAARGDRPAAAPGEVVVSRWGTTAVVATPSHLHVVRTTDGQHRWSVPTPDRDNGVWRAWGVDDAVIAASARTIAAFDADDGALRWQRLHDAGQVLPLTTGVALLAQGELAVVGAASPDPTWTREVSRPAQLPRATSMPTSGPVVVTGARTVLLDPLDGTVLVDLGPRASAVRASNGITVAVHWESDGSRASELVGLGPDGSVRWTRPGPHARCCSVHLRTTSDGRVVVSAPGDTGARTGWVVRPSTGEVETRLVRPRHVGRYPVAVDGGAAVWLDRDSYVATDAEGRVRWRAESEVTLLSEGPVLLATREGLVRPGVRTVTEPRGPHGPRSR
jgi:outer membrane protein assembly factor BamB